MPAGTIEKMTGELKQPVAYSLPIGEERLPMNPLIGKALSVHYTGVIRCIACGRTTAKSFNQGYCYPCFRSLARCDLCIVKPEQCHYHEGTCREPEWADAHCMQPHIVYLANSSGLKVGITRQSQIPTRWIDQGASQALPILKVKNRYHSGLVEQAMKSYVADKTDWRKMIKNDSLPVDLVAQRDHLLTQAKDALISVFGKIDAPQPEVIDEALPVNIEYPVLEYPKKIQSLNLDKNPEFSGILMGIKGQYLIFDVGVINMRKYGGYTLEIIMR